MTADGILLAKLGGFVCDGRRVGTPTKPPNPTSAFCMLFTAIRSGASEGAVGVVDETMGVDKACAVLKAGKGPMGHPSSPMAPKNGWRGIVSGEAREVASVEEAVRAVGSDEPNRAGDAFEICLAGLAGVVAEPAKMPGVWGSMTGVTGEVWG